MRRFQRKARSMRRFSSLRAPGVWTSQVEGIVALIRRSTFSAFSVGADEDFDAVELAIHVEKTLRGGDVDADPFGVLVRGDGADGERERLIAASAARTDRLC